MKSAIWAINHWRKVFQNDQNEVILFNSVNMLHLLQIAQQNNHHERPE